MFEVNGNSRVHSAMNTYLVVALLVSSLLFLPLNSNYASVQIESNGTGAHSIILTTWHSFVSVFQSNTTQIHTEIDVDADTGGNFITGSDGARITTGDISQNVRVELTGNTNVLQETCCTDPPAVPEFGVMTGALALLSSTGAWFAFRGNG